MQDSNPWRTERPNEGLVIDEPAFQPGMPVRSMLPERYEHGYAYPLLVLFHGRGGSEEQILKIAPKVSKQNFVLPEPPRPGADRPPQEWQDCLRLGPRGCRRHVRRIRPPERAVGSGTYHIHSERIFLLGVREGAEAAFRAAFALGGKVAGVVALNGLMPRPTEGKPVFRMDDVNHMKCFLGHGEFNPKIAKTDADNDYRALYGAGADVQYKRYASDKQLHPNMMTDVNQWLINHVNAEHDLYVDRDEE